MAVSGDQAASTERRQSWRPCSIVSAGDHALACHLAPSLTYCDSGNSRQYARDHLESDTLQSRKWAPISCGVLDIDIGAERVMGGGWMPMKFLDLTAQTKKSLPTWNGIKGIHWNGLMSGWCECLMSSLKVMNPLACLGIEIYYNCENYSLVRYPLTHCL